MINVLSAGACKGLFQALFAKQLNNGKLQAAFGAVGAMQEKLLGGEACDILVLTIPMLEKLAAQKWVVASSITPIGEVGTGIAVPATMTSWPAVHTPDVLKANLLAATSVHFPDPARATAGIHFKSVLDQLNIYAALESRCHLYPNGATAMAALASGSRALGHMPIGCTQVSEILYTPGVSLVAELPPPFVLRTVYAAALTPAGLESPRALEMINKLCSSKSLVLRHKGGFKTTP